MAELRTKLVIDAENRARNALRGAQGDVDRLKQSFSDLKRELATVAIAAISAQSIKGLVDVADSYKLIAARVQLASKSTEEFERAQTALFQISQRTQSALAETSNLYVRLANALGDLGVTQEQALAVTELVGNAMRLSGASAEESANATRQFAQAMAGGVIQAEEMNSIIDQSPRLAQAMADGLGLTVAQFRALVREGGKLTSADVLKGLLTQIAKVAAEAEKLPTLVGRSFTQLGNEFTRFVGQLDSSTGVTAGISSGIQAVARNFDALATSVLAAGGVIVSTLAGRATGAIQQYVAAQAAKISADLASRQSTLAAAEAARIHAALMVGEAEATVAASSGMARLSAVTTTLIPARNALATAETRLAAAQEAASLSARALGSGLSLIGGPLGLITTLLGLGATAWVLWGNRASEAASKAAAKLENVKRILADISQEKQFGAGDLGSLREREQQLEQAIAVQVQSRSAGAVQRLAQLRSELEQVQSGISTLEQRGADIPAKAAGDASGRTAALQFMNDFETKAQKLSEALAKLEKHKPFMSAAEIKATQAEITRRFTDAAPKVATAKTDKRSANYVSQVFEDATRDLEQFAGRQKAALDELLGGTTIAKTQRLQEAVALLRREFEAGRIGPDQYREAVDQLTSSFSKASDEMATLQQLIADTDFGKTQELTRRVGVADNALFGGLIDDKTHQQIISNLTEVKEKADDTFSTLAEAARGAGRQAAQAMTDMVFEGKSSLNLLESFARDIFNRMFLSITEPLSKAAVSGIEGLLSGVFASKHSGGIVGQPGGLRVVSPLAFLGAQRYHSGGLVRGEVPIIARAGEEVLTEDDPRHRNNKGGGVALTVNLIEAPGRGGEVQSSQEGGQINLDMMVEMIESKMSANIGRGTSKVFQALQAVSGLSRMPGAVR